MADKGLVGNIIQIVCTIIINYGKPGSLVLRCTTQMTVIATYIATLAVESENLACYVWTDNKRNIYGRKNVSLTNHKHIAIISCSPPVYCYTVAIVGIEYCGITEPLEDETDAIVCPKQFPKSRIRWSVRLASICSNVFAINRTVQTIIVIPLQDGKRGRLLAFTALCIRVGGSQFTIRYAQCTAVGTNIILL